VGGALADGDGDKLVLALGAGEAVGVDLGGGEHS
jgi:hypothetical protein